MLALTALMIPAMLIGGFFEPYLWLGAAALIAFYLFGIRKFLSVLTRRMNPMQVLLAAGMHWFYHVYASATYALVMLGTRLGIRRRADRDALVPLKRVELAQ
jgi:hypothetical protein